MSLQIVELSYVIREYAHKTGKPIEHECLVRYLTVRGGFPFLLWLCPDQRDNLDPGGTQDHGLHAGPCWPCPYRPLGLAPDGCRCGQAAVERGCACSPGG